MNKNILLYNIIFIIILIIILFILLANVSEILSLLFYKSIRNEYSIFWGSQEFPFYYKNLYFYISYTFIYSIICLYSLIISFRFYRRYLLSYNKRGDTVDKRQNKI